MPRFREPAPARSPAGREAPCDPVLPSRRSAGCPPLPWLWEPFKASPVADSPQAQPAAGQTPARFGGAYSGLDARRQQLVKDWVARFSEVIGRAPGAWSLLRRTDHALPEDDVRRHHLRADDDAAHGRVGHEVTATDCPSSIAWIRSGDRSSAPRGSTVPHVRPPQAGRR